MSTLAVRRFPVLWTGIVLNVGAGVVAGATGVEGASAGALAFQGVILVVLMVAVPLAKFAAEDALPLRVVLSNAVVILAGCAFSLAFPHDQREDGTISAVTSLLGTGQVSPDQASTLSTIAWGAFLLGWLAGFVNWGLCVVAARQRKDAQAAA